MTDGDTGIEPLQAYGAAAFLGNSIAQRNARVSQLLTLGAMLRGIEDSDIDEMVLATGAPRISARSEPRFRPLEEVSRRVLDDFAPALAAIEERPDPELELAMTAWLATSELRSPDAGFALLYQSLNDPDTTVRAASAAILALTYPVREDLVLASLQAALSQPIGYGSVFAEIASGPGPDGRVPTDDGVPNSRDSSITEPMSVVVHGTFARLATYDHKWYLPKAELPSHIRGTCTPDLFDGVNYFRWSGEYSSHGRARATDDLLRWCDLQGLRHLDTVYAHSHGGNVVLDAVQRGLSVDLVVLLHTPVLHRSEREWAAIQGRVKRFVDLRNSMDWVVGMDKLRTFSHNRLPAQLTNSRRLTPTVAERFRFSHDRFIQKKTWTDLALHEEIAFERSLA